MSPGSAYYTAQFIAALKSRLYSSGTTGAAAGTSASVDAAVANATAVPSPPQPPAVPEGAAAAATAAGSWSLLFSIPHLIMMSNLQSFFGARNVPRPSIQPNEYMDSVIANTKVAMKERY